MLQRENFRLLLCVVVLLVLFTGTGGAIVYLNAIGKEGGVTQVLSVATPIIAIIVLIMRTDQQTQATANGQDELKTSVKQLGTQTKAAAADAATAAKTAQEVAAVAEQAIPPAQAKAMILEALREHEMDKARAVATNRPTNN